MLLPSRRAHDCRASDDTTVRNPLFARTWSLNDGIDNPIPRASGSVSTLKSAKGLTSYKYIMAAPISRSPSKLLSTTHPKHTRSRPNDLLFHRRTRSGKALFHCAPRALFGPCFRNMFPSELFPKLPIGHGEMECREQLERPVLESCADRSKGGKWVGSLLTASAERPSIADMRDD